MVSISLSWPSYRQYSLSLIASPWSSVSAIVCHVLCPVILSVRYTWTRYFPFSGFTCANIVICIKLNMLISLLQRYEDYFIYAIVYALNLLLLCIINYCFYGVRSRKTFARAFAWAQAEAKRGMDPGEWPRKGKKVVLARVGRTHNNCVEWYVLM